jgi:hypothetical protein
MAKTASKKRQEKDKKVKHIKLHKSFRRSYREDYVRPLETPGLLAHSFAALRLIFRNKKMFIPLILISVLLSITLVGLMSEATYRQFQDILDQTEAELAGGEIGNVAKAGLLLISTITTGGLSGSSSESAMIFFVLIFLLVWLVTIFILRHILAGHKIKLRDAMYNAGAPLVPTFIVLSIVFLQCIPLFILVIVHSAAVTTGFLETPFYALVYFVFALAMLATSGYFLSSSLMALVAVTAPGLYPIRAMRAASDLMAGRRIKFCIRLIYLLISTVFIWVLIMLPIILIDMGLKSAFDWLTGVPIVPIALVIMTCFTFVYFAAYLYVYYRWMIRYDEQHKDN